MFDIDARGLSCPEPVVRVQKGVKANPEGGKIVVDAAVAVENIKRFAAARKYQVDVTQDGRDYTLTLKK
jgi:tRNA 2-thiouridine synthesizing protein A